MGQNKPELSREELLELLFSDRSGGLEDTLCEEARIKIKYVLQGRSENACTAEDLISVDSSILKAHTDLTPEERVSHIQSLLALLASNPQKIKETALNELAAIFSIDRESFRTVNFQTVFENIEHPDNGLNALQVRSLLLHLIHLTEHQDNPDVRYQLHMILDLFVAVMESLQADEFAAEGKGNIGTAGTVLTEDFFISVRNFALLQSRDCANYLLSRKFLDIWEMSQQDNSEKPDGLDGVAGASADETIYAFRRALDNYALRTNQNYYAGHANTEPLLPIAPGYAASYMQGQLNKIFRLSEEKSTLAQELITQNDPQLSEKVYAALNDSSAPRHSSGRLISNRTGGLMKLQIISDIQTECEETGKEFLFDFSRINTHNLHPYVVGFIVHANNETLRKHAAETPSALEKVDENTLWQKIYPEGSSEEKKYLWRMLESLSVRKKVEDDFGIDIADYDLWIQRMLLEYIDSLTIANLEQVKTFLNAGNNKRERVVALASTTGNTAAQKALFTLCSPDHDAFLQAFAESIQLTDETVTRIETLCAEANVEVPRSREEIFRSVFTQSSHLLDRYTSTDEPAKREEIRKILQKDQENIRFTRHLVDLLPRTELATLDLTQLQTVQCVGPVSARELRADPAFADIEKDMFSAVEKGFPEGAVDAFARYLDQDTTKLFYTTCEGRLIAFFGVSDDGMQPQYLDWYATNPNRPVDSLNLATMITGVKTMEHPHGFYAAAKPYVDASFRTLIEELGCTAHGYMHEFAQPYLLCRNLQQERGKYIGKQMSTQEILTLGEQCPTPNQILTTSIQDKPIKICRVSYRNKRAQESVDPSESAWFLYEQLSGQETDDVLTRMVPVPGRRQEYICILEPSALLNLPELPTYHEHDNRNHLGAA